ncbi:unnamed protein product [Adineta steineri]|uniref:Uncharacterized protein n=2 Tax=Adineta steineri TaxID=433720 RepID=A0A813TZJ6_9BILA|nr:unnamed protein product [Adineta steineri]
MKKLSVSSIFTLLILLTIVHSIPCPRECICKPTYPYDTDFIRMSYLMDCTNVSLNNDKLIYEAQQWSIDIDEMNNQNDDKDITTDYDISIDLSNSLSLKKFINKTIDLTGFSFELRSLSLTNQQNKFILTPNSFYSTMYDNLKILNLSSCCQQIPKDCSQIFRPLIKLQVLDLSRSDMYKTCLNTPDTISSTLQDLILSNNNYNGNTFSHSSKLFDGVRTISGKLDLQNSRFQIGTQLEGNCLFDLFQQITILDFSNIQFESTSNNDIEIHLKHFLKCKTENGQQLVTLYLRSLELEKFPEWFTNDRFPLLRQLDLSNNNFYSIDINTFSNLRHISLAYNPIRLKNITWHGDTIYDSINLRSTIHGQKVNISHGLKNLFKLTKNIDYSDNEGQMFGNISNVPIELDFPSEKFFLNISRTNLYTFQMDSNDIRQLDISWNFLNELNLNEQIKLNYLDCSNQNLKNLILNEQILELNVLKCSNNSLKTIENFSLINKEKLTFIDLSYNKIDTLKYLLSNLTSRYLRTVNLQSNSIRIIRSYTFHENLISLYEINLSWNQINRIEKYAFQSPNLQILDLTGNPLKNIEAKAFFTASLRLFFIFNNSQELTNRCLQSKSYDNLIFMYTNWLQQNGTLMKNIQIKPNKCFNRYVTQKRIDWIIQKSKHVFAYYILYIAIGACLVGIIFAGVYYYRKNKFTLLAPIQRYKKLDRLNLVENAAEMDQHQREDDEIVMNLHEAPFNKFSHDPTNV